MEGNLTLAGMHSTLAGNNRRVTLDPGRKYQKEIPEGNTRRYEHENGKSNSMAGSCGNDIGIVSGL
jgi:hypothetical protein